jgi:hypothetical protein
LWQLDKLTHLGFFQNPVSPEDEIYVGKVPETILEYLRKKSPLTLYLSYALADVDQYPIRDLAEYLTNQKEIAQVFKTSEEAEELVRINMSQCHLMLVVASKNSMSHSDRCQRELEIADKYALPAIPLLCPDLDPNSLSQKRLALQFGREFQVETFSNFCSDLYHFLYQLKRNVNLMVKSSRKKDIFRIYEQFHIIYRDYESRFQQSINELEQRIESLEDLKRRMG